LIDRIGRSRSAARVLTSISSEEFIYPTKISALAAEFAASFACSFVNGRLDMTLTNGRFSKVDCLEEFAR
jgi:hypothetical protein